MRSVASEKRIPRVVKTSMICRDVSPLGAPNPGPDPEPSPYYPSTRRFGSPLYLRIEEVPGAELLGYVPRLYAHFAARAVGVGRDHRVDAVPGTQESGQATADSGTLLIEYRTKLQDTYETTISLGMGRSTATVAAGASMVIVTTPQQVSLADSRRAIFKTAVDRSETTPFSIRNS